MTFAHPAFVPLAIAAIALFALGYLWLQRRRAGAVLRYSSLPFLIAAAQPPRWPARALFAAWLIAFAAVAIAAAGPRANADLPVRGGSVIVCVDTSGSMATQDVAPSRAAAAQAAMRSFIQVVPQGVAVGIVSFAGGAQLVYPPARDRDKAIEALSAIPPPNGATAIGDALLLAMHSLPAKGTRDVILITDGENNAGTDPVAAARMLASAHIKLYTIGIGTNSGALVPGTLIAAGIDGRALRQYAALTGGSYSRADNADDLRRELSTLGRTVTFERRPVALAFPLAFAGALLMIGAFFAGIWTKSI